MEESARSRRGYSRCVTTESSFSTNESLVRALVVKLATDRGHDGTGLRDDQPLSSIGFDSLLTIELVARLEDELQVEVPDELLTPASFETLGSLLTLVNSLR